MEVYTKHCTKSQVRFLPSSKFQLTPTYRKSSKRFLLCNSVILHMLLSIMAHISRTQICGWVVFIDTGIIQMLQPIKQFLTDCHGILWSWFSFWHHEASKEDTDRSGDSHCPIGYFEGPWISSSQEKDSSWYQSRKHFVELWRPCKTCRLWCCWTIDSMNIRYTHGNSISIYGFITGHDGQTKHCDWYAILDGTRSDSGNWLWLRRWYLELR